jgi:hypothetical protein
MGKRKKLFIICLLTLVLLFSFSMAFTQDITLPGVLPTTPDTPRPTITSPVPEFVPQDMLIPLQYPKEMIRDDQSIIDSFNNPSNKGMIWIPKEAIGKSVPLIITLHGWRSFSDPVNIYVGPNSHKFFDKIARDAIDLRNVKPVVIAAPMHDKGPKSYVFGSQYYDFSTHVAMIHQKLTEQGVGIESVSVTGHSNALCGEGLKNAVASGINLYLIGMFDGTCDLQNYAQKIIPSNSNSIVFNMYQPAIGTTTAGHTDAGNYIKGSNPQSFTSTYSQLYSSMFKNSNKPWYDLVFTGSLHLEQLGFYGQTIGTKNEISFSSPHGAIPSVGFREMLEQFFSIDVRIPPVSVPVAPPPVTAPVAVRGGVPGAGVVAPAYTATAATLPRTRTVERTIPGCPRCKEIDSVWERMRLLIGGIGKDKVWDTEKSKWNTHQQVYTEVVNVDTYQVPGRTSGGISISPSYPSAAQSSGVQIPAPTGPYVPSAPSVPVSGPSSSFERQFSSLAGFDDWIRKEASFVEKVGLLPRSKTPRAQTKFIVLHDAGRYDLNGLLVDWGKRNVDLSTLPECQGLTIQQNSLCGRSSVSSHYHIGCDGTVTILIDDHLVASHAGCDSSHNNCYLPGINSQSIGIDIQNCGKNPGTTETNQKQYSALNQLIGQLSTNYNIPKDDEHVIGHFEVGKHNDPGEKFVWANIGLNDHRKNGFCCGKSGQLGCNKFIAKAREVPNWNCA